MNIQNFMANYWNQVQKNDELAFLKLFHYNAKVYLGKEEKIMKPDEYMSSIYDFEHGWDIRVEHIEEIAPFQYVTKTLWQKDDKNHLVSTIFTFKDEKIMRLEETFEY